MQNEVMTKILITNDDGIHSPGPFMLRAALKDLGTTWIVAPEKPKSATGLGMTLHKPLRIKRFGNEERTYAISGTPSDIIHLARNVIVQDIDLVVSGVNIGDNTSTQVILSSGTVGAAAQAALEGIPAMAVSAAVSSAEEIVNNRALTLAIKAVVHTLAKHALEHGLPEGVDLLNINFPAQITEKTRVVLAPAAKTRFSELVEERTDPLGNKYYWIYGEPKDPVEGTDVYEVFVAKNIAVTPISLNINADIFEPIRHSAVSAFVAAGQKELEKLRGNLENV
jgi:5'-nucleotidase